MSKRIYDLNRMRKTYPLIRRKPRLAELDLKIIETEAVVKGQTATSSYKPALLEGNIKTTVPPFIGVGDLVVINTSDSSYIEKAKK